MFPVASKARPAGALSLAWVAGPPSPLKPAVPVPRHCRYDSRRIHLANTVVVDFRDVNVSSAIHGQAEGIREGSAGGRSAVAGKTSLAVAREGADDSRGIHLSDADVAAVAEII